MTEQEDRLSAAAVPRRVSFWLVVVMTAVYLGHFEAAYRSNATCHESTRQTRVVVESSLPGVDEPVIAIGSNAGYVIVVSGANCKAKKDASQSPDLTDGRDEAHLGDVLRDLGRQVSGRVRFLWSRLPRTGSSEGKLPQAVVVPLSRVLCMYDMYDEPANPATGAVASSLCTAETSDNGSSDPPRLEERLKTEIRNKLEENNVPKCNGDLRISPPIVFRPYESDQLAATAGPDSVDHAIQSLRLETAAETRLYVFGYASADGPGNHNRTLSEQRADHVRALVEGKEQQVVATFPMGEDHLVNGVAESRGARLVACVQPKPSQ